MNISLSKEYLGAVVECLCLPSPCTPAFLPIHMLHPNPQGDGIRSGGGGLWEVIGPEDGALTFRLSYFDLAIGPIKVCF